MGRRFIVGEDVLIVGNHAFHDNAGVIIERRLMIFGFVWVVELSFRRGARVCVKSKYLRRVKE